jgi:hypothetical protein
MKISLTAVLLALLPLPSFAQYAFESAEILREMVSLNQEGAKPVAELKIDAETAGILIAFDDSLSALPIQSVTYVDILDRYAHNPFINDWPGARIRLIKGQRGIEGLLPRTGAAMGGAGVLGLEVTGLADGLAKFLVKRTKQELNEMFFRQLREALDRHPEFGAIFPATQHTLSAIGSQIFQLDGYIGLLRESAQNDFQQLPGNLADVLANRNWIADSTVQAVAVEMFGAAQLLVDGRPLPELIDHLADGPALQQTEVGGPFRLLRAFSESFRSSSGPDQGYWLSFERVRTLLDDPRNEGYHLFLGLLYQRYGELRIAKSHTLGELLADNKADLTALKGLLRRLVQLTGRVQEKTARQNGLLRMSAPEGAVLSLESATLDDCLEFLSLGDALHTQLRAGKPEDPAQRTLLQKALLTLRHGAALELQIRHKRYASSVVTVLDIAQLWIKNTAVRQPILRLGSFLAALADAESSDQVAAAIEAFALPPGSAALKKQTAFSIGLNSYVGAYYGQEFTFEAPPLNGAVGLNSPIGFSLNWGWHWGNTRKGKPVQASVSALFSAIDIGAVTAYRFRDSTTQALPEIKLGDILSPGAFLILGLPGVPLSIGGGLQYAPTLKAVGQLPGAGTLLRWSAFLGVDIPIFHLYNRPRKEKTD